MASARTPCHYPSQSVDLNNSSTGAAKRERHAKMAPGSRHRRQGMRAKNANGRYWLSTWHQAPGRVCQLETA